MKALRGLKANKAPGVDLIAVQLPQTLEQAEKNIIFKSVCDMYETGVIPNDFKLNRIVTIPRKVGADKCENYRTISLITHESKILDTINYRRIEQAIESSLDEDQLGSKKEKGTRGALLSLPLIQNGRIRVEKPTFIAFVDLKKAFGQVSWRKLFQIFFKKKNKVQGPENY